jgi:hypothetical protein
MLKIIRIALVALTTPALLLACEDKPAVPEPTKEVAAPTEIAPPPSADELKAKFAEEAKDAITADNADAVADELEKEIDDDAE